MTEAFPLKRRSEWAKNTPIQSLPGMTVVFTIILLILCPNGQGYMYRDDYGQPQSYNYEALPSPYIAYSAPPAPPQYDLYTAVTYQEVNASLHCGVIPDTNFELYRSNSDPYGVADVAPFGKFPWIVLILSYNKVVCQGTILHHNFILTSAHCIPEYSSLENYEIRVGDWDILTNYNEYEAYADRELRICSRRALTTSYSSKGGYTSRIGGSYYKQQMYKYYADDFSDLILIKSDFEPSLKFPQVRPLCLPKTYSSPAYNNQYQDPYASYATCWVAGWYGSEITQLRNHAMPEKVSQSGGYSGYSYGGQGPSYYGQKYYKGYDSSMIQKRAKVKQVNCPSYSYSYGYSPSSEVCFIGVDGYDACVAEQGAAVFCVIKEDQNYGEYTSGYNNQDSSPSAGPPYEPVDVSYEIPVMSSLHPDYDVQKVNKHYSAPQIQAAPSPSKPDRYRAVLYAVVQKPAYCRIGYDSYGNSYNRKSRPLVATRVDYETVSGIVDQFWTHGYDKSCPMTNAKYKEPPRPFYGNSYKSSYYFTSYYYNAPGNNYGYGRRPMSFSVHY